MTFSKLNFVAACLLLGMGGLLVSCGGTKPDETSSRTTVQQTENCVETAGCIENTINEPSTICPESDEPKGPKEHKEESADCTKSELVYKKKSAAHHNSL
jgi:hypothetical protein